jgi:hypothetical protein
MISVFLGCESVEVQSQVWCDACPAPGLKYCLPCRDYWSWARGSPAQHPVSEDQAEINRRTVAGVIMSLCEGMGEQQGEGAKQLALMMP